ncbi:MAG: GAF domain-containing protein [Thermodesulfovibrionales bacterium]|nr:GAF domain-containing protein [Thermodesulfovibrionales bacterium]
MFGNLYKDIINAIDDAIYCINPDKKIVFWNKGAERLTGLSSTAVEGLSVNQSLLLYSQEDTPLSLEEYPCVVALKSAIPDRNILKLYYNNDKSIQIEETVYPVLKNSKVQSVVGIFRILSKKPQEYLEQQLINICAWCKKIKTQGDRWITVEDYLAETSSSVFTHGMCSDCAEKIFQKKVYLENYQMICKAISSSVSLKEVFDLIVNNIVKVLNVKACMLRLINHKTNTLDIASHCGLSENYIKRGSIQIDQSIRDILEGKSVSVYDTLNDKDDKHRAHIEAEGIRTILSVPVKTNKEIIGVVRMYSAEQANYTDEDFRFVRALADQAAIAITNAKIFESTVSRAREYLRVFKEVTQAVNSTLQLQKVLDLIVKKLPETMRLKGATVRLFDSDEKILKLVASYGLSQKYLNKGPVDLEDNVKIALNKGAVAIYDVSSDPRVIYKKEAEEEGIKSMLTLPIIFKGKVIGILRLFTSEHRMFTDEDIDFTTSLAEVCGTAIENARLFEELRQQRGTDVY